MPSPIALREDLKLVPIGKQIVATPTGSKEVDTFCVDTMLPNNVNFEGIIVIDSEIGSQTAGGEPIGMLVGMDIIGRGDFAVTNHNGRTIFTYRCPSVGSIDFVNQLVMKNKIGTPHGKGNGKRKAKKDKTPKHPHLAERLSGGVFTFVEKFSCDAPDIR